MWKFTIFITLFFVCACGGSGGSGNTGGGNGGGGGDVTVRSDITTAEYLKAMSQDCSMDFFLKADIVVNEPWQAVCEEGYTGTFEGGGYTITFNNNVTGGLFAKLGTDGSVKDVKINISSQGSVDGINVALTSDPDNKFLAFGGVAALAEADSGNIENCIVNIDGSILPVAYAGGITGYGGNISKSYAIIKGNISGSEYAGGITGRGDSVTNCFAIVTGDIQASSNNGYAGGIAGYGVKFADNAAFVDPTRILNAKNNGSVFGARESDSATDINHAYRSPGGDAKNGKNFSLASLFFIEWWNRAGFDEPDWYLGQDKLPLQKIFYDKGVEPDDIWIFIDSVSTEIVDTLPDGFACDKSYTLPGNMVVTAEWTGLCDESNPYRGIFNGDNYTIIFKENVNGGFFKEIGFYIEPMAFSWGNLNIVVLKNINGIALDDSNNISFAGAAAARSDGVIADVFAYIRGDISAKSGDGNAGGLVGICFGVLLNGNYVIVDGSIYGSSYAGGAAGYLIEVMNDTAVIIGGDIISEDGAGGVAGIDTNSFMKNSFAIVNGSIKANPDNYGSAGGIVGIANSLISNNIAIVDIDKIIASTTDPDYPNKGNIWGFTSNSGKNNYIFTPGYAGFITPDGQSGQSVMAADLKLASWWQDKPLFSLDLWHLEDGYVPLPQSLYDRGIPQNTFPDWVNE